MRRRKINMQYIYMANMFEDNRQLTPFVIGIAVCVIIGLVIATIIIKVMDKELRAVVWFGAGLGALIGCVNLFINT